MFRRKEKLDVYEEDSMTVANKEEEIIESYFDEALFKEKESDYIIEEDEDEYQYNDLENYTLDTLDEKEENEDYLDSDEYEYQASSNINYKKIINIIFVIIIIILTMITVDVISVARYNRGPFFAIPLEKYKDGGSKIYYGFGYKVIKYAQLQGRKDTQIGFWNLKYNTEPYTIKDLDLAIEFTENNTKTYKKYYKKFIRVTSTLENIDTTNNKLILTYHDEGNKYTLNLECSMAIEKANLKKLKTGEETTVIGTVTDYDFKTKEKPNKLYISDCFAEQ